MLWYHWKDIGKPIFLAAIKPLITEFCIDHRLESYRQQKEVVAIYINFFASPDLSVSKVSIHQTAVYFPRNGLLIQLTTVISADALQQKISRGSKH